VRADYLSLVDDELENIMLADSLHGRPPLELLPIAVAVVSSAVSLPMLKVIFSSYEWSYSFHAHADINQSESCPAIGIATYI
jgi:hypothetical protein